MCSNDEDPFQVPLAQIVAGDAEKAGLKVLGDDGVNTTDGTEFAAEVQKVSQSGAQAVFFSGGTSSSVVTLWRELHGADPHLLLLGPSTMVNAGFATQIGQAAQSTYLSTPLLPASMYPASAQRLFADYSRHFHEPPTPDALYGYEAMSVVLEAIRKAGSARQQTPGGDRPVLRHQESRLGARALLDPAQRRHHALALWRRPDRERAARLLQGVRSLAPGLMLAAGRLCGRPVRAEIKQPQASAERSASSSCGWRKV